MKKILVVDESALFREYLSSKLEELGFEVIQGKNGFDAVLKIKSEIPDLIIMDYYLSRKSSMEVLEEKKQNRNAALIPVILIATKLDKQSVVKLAKYDVKKIVSKPVKMDLLIKSVSESLDVKIQIDETPCIIEAHFNEDILFVEVARGLNHEKIELLEYKITELLELYQVKIPKVLVMISNMEISETDLSKLDKLMKVVMENAQKNPRLIKILTNSPVITRSLQKSRDYGDIQVTDSLEKAMDDLLGIKPDQIAHDEVALSKILTTSAPKKHRDETIQMRFEAERPSPGEGDGTRRGVKGVFSSKAVVAVVDDDLVIQELVKTVFSETNWKLISYNNGKEFLDDLPNHDFDLIFLDLMMPVMNGFQVLQTLRTKKQNLPIIVFSALSQQETVTKAVSFGIKSYMIKPLKPEQLLKKAEEILSLYF